MRGLGVCLGEPFGILTCKSQAAPRYPPPSIAGFDSLPLLNPGKTVRSATQPTLTMIGGDDHEITKDF